MQSLSLRALVAAGFLFSVASLRAQSLGNAGTIEGIVVDPSGAVVSGATVELANPLTGFQQSAITDAEGAFRFLNIPPNRYRVAVSAAGFARAEQQIDVRTNVPMKLRIPIALATQAMSVTVTGEAPTLIENVPVAHTDVDRSLVDKLPITAPASGLNDAITATSPGVAADSNGFFHPLGDHAEVTFSIDGQPISDQQSKLFSTSIPLNAIQSMELVTGAPSAEFGDKTSLVVDAATRSGLGEAKPHGGLTAQYGSFGTYSEEATLAFGGARFGNFLAANALRSGRFLDTPEFVPIHAVGNNQTLFDRLDLQPNSRDALHFNAFVARNWFQVPNTLDQRSQDQRQKVVTFNFAPGYQHSFGGSALFTANPFVRRDHVRYYPSADPAADTPATISQDRTLLNYGLRADLSAVRGLHSLKVGVQAMQTRLQEQFTFGITDPGFNPICVNAAGEAQELPAVTNPAACAERGLLPNPMLRPGLVAYDLTRGGSPLNFSGEANINQFAFYVQDAMTLGALTANVGLRLDRYDGLTHDASAQPRLGVSYLLRATQTVLRLSYSRAFETPFNENLILSSAAGTGGLSSNALGAQEIIAIKPGRRNQYNAGIQQNLTRYLQLDADYFWKYTEGAFDFSALFDTPITFPISWRKSKIDGLGLRLSTPSVGGFQAFATMGHTRARFFGPEVGGVISNERLRDTVFRIDHDQAFQQTTNLRYQFPKAGPWVNLTWRYDSGLVAGSVPDVAAALTLTPAQQAAIGFFCAGVRATPQRGITACPSGGGATRIVIPPEGTENDDHNPPRIAPRHLLDLGIGSDDLFHKEPLKIAARFTVENLTNKIALYNFLSTFSGTHFVEPRTYSASLGVRF